MAHELIAQLLIWNCLTAKESKFADEREVRGIILNVKENFDPYRKTFGSRDYVEHKLDLKTPGAIAEILVGPLAPVGAEARSGTSFGIRDIRPVLRCCVPSRRLGGTYAISSREGGFAGQEAEDAMGAGRVVQPERPRALVARLRRQRVRWDGPTTTFAIGNIISVAT
jgi:hypothetical protein